MLSVFVKRPIFAGVISALIFLAGLVSIPSLPIAEYPQIAPPQVVVTSTYIGADATTVESAVTNPLEEQINGVQDMQYMSSSSTNDGVSTITVTFQPSRDIDAAAVDVQNRVQDAQGQLPTAVTQTGIQITKTAGSFIMGIAFTSTNKSITPLELSNYLDRNVKDPILRVVGVSSIQIFGERKYAMRIWIDPQKLAHFGLGPSDVTAAVGAQNINVPAGKIGQAPAPPDQRATLTVQVPGQLVTADQFGKIVVKHGADGALVRLNQVARIELGAQDYSTNNFWAGKNAIGLGVSQTNGANALQLSSNIRALLERIRPTFPAGVDYAIPYDTSTFVRASTKEVLITLVIAILLVVATIYLFLQDLKTTFIPVITIPVSLVGTFAFVQIFHFSINSLVLFGMTLATGLVVDDAIVVIENITRVIEEDPERDRQDATIQGLQEIFGAVIATSLVLLAVFIPTAFVPGTTGAIYKQFALTIAFSIAISAVVAVTLTPALAALLIGDGQPPNFFLFRWFNRGLARLRGGYAWILPKVVKIRYLIALGLVGILAATYVLFELTPTGFIPEEDQGILFALIQAPEGASINVTDGVIHDMERIVKGNPNVIALFGVAGAGFGGNAPNQGLAFIQLKPWANRSGANNSAAGVIASLAPQFAKIGAASIQVFNPPAIQGLGTRGGFDYELEDRSSGSLTALAGVAGKLIGAANQNPTFGGVYTQFRATSPTLETRVNRASAEALGASIGNVFGAISTGFGSTYVNNFTYKDRTYRVYVQNDAPYRSATGDITRLEVPNASPATTTVGSSGDTTVAGSSGLVTPTTGTTGASSIPSGTATVPLASLVTASILQQPPNITHYQLYRSVEIQGAPAPGKSSGQALSELGTLSKQLLPTGYTYDYTGVSLTETQSGSATFLVFGMGLIVVFLVLAALYESLADPLVILLSVPAALLGALGALELRGIESDVYAQVGFVMLIGLAAKNAILIVEFANQQREAGKSIVDAVVDASETRLRPILMTSIAFIFGLLPLVFASGAGAASRHSLGTAVIGGMLVSTLLNLFVVPALYVIINELVDRYAAWRAKYRKEKPHRQRREQPAG